MGATVGLIAYFKGMDRITKIFFSRKTEPWIVAILAALITILVYLPALNNGFVNWDDHSYIYENRNIKSIDFGSLKWMFTSFHASNWHPLAWLSHAVDYAMWGLNPVGHHLSSILLHGLNTFLVVILIIRLLKAVKPEDKSNQLPGSLIAGLVTGLLFGLHPLHVESVAWVSERKDVLYSFFFLLSLLTYLKYTSSSQQKQKRSIYVLSLLFFVMSLMSKPMAVTLPVVLLIVDIYPFGRLNLKSWLKAQKELLIEKIPFFVLSIVSSIVTVIAQRTGGAITPLEEHFLIDRILVALRGLGFYLSKMVWPTDLCPVYPYPSKISVLSLQYMGSFILVLSITAFCIWSWKQQKVFSAVWTYYVVTLLPVLGIIRVGEQAAADRYTYLPSLGPFLLAGLAAAYIWKKVDIKQHVSMHIRLSILISLILIIGILPIITVKQIGIWKDSLTLWNRELKIFPTYYRAYKNRGHAYDQLGDYPQAIIDYDKAIKFNPFYTKAYVNRGIAYSKSGSPEKAVKDYNMAIMINPKDIKAYYNRGIDYKKLGQYRQAVRDFDMTVELDSKCIAAYVNRGAVYAKLCDYQSAIKDFNSVIELDPYDEITYNRRGMAYMNSGNYQQAIRDFSNAIRLKPQYIEPYNNRGNIFAMIGKHQQAIEDFDMAIKLNSRAADVYVNRGTLYLNMGNNLQANKDFRSAARLGDREAQKYLKAKGIGW